MAQRKRSDMWLHFTAINDEKAKCDLCKSEFSYKGGGTTNLKRHLSSRHPTVLQKRPHTSAPPQANLALENLTSVEPFRRATTEVPLTDPLVNPGPSRTNVLSISTAHLQQGTITNYITRPASITKQRRLNFAVFKFIIKDFQPFSVVNDEGFRQLIKEIDPSYTLPSRSMLTKSLLPQHYEECVNSIKECIGQIASIAITTDTWTSSSTESYMAITGHMVNSECEMQSVLLDCIDVSSSSHTAEYLKDTLLECFIKHGIEKKISAIVTDNAANISAAIRLFKLEHIRCVAHTLNLIVQDALKEISAIKKKVKAIVEYFHRSILGNDKLKQLQTQISGTAVPLKLINDVVTRWNSTFYMFERFYQLREPIEAALALLHVKDLEMLTNSEMEALSEICKILKPFNGITAELSAENNVTISKVLVLVEGVKHYLGKLSVTTPLATLFKRVITANILERFQNAERNYIFQLALYIDPRFKKIIISETAFKQTQDRVTRLVTDMIKGESTANEIPEEVVTVETEESYWDYYNSKTPAKSSTSTSPTAMAIMELRRYSEEDNIAKEDNPLKWWESRSNIYPHLFILAKRILSIPASSVPSERVFSKTGLILSERRNRIKPKNLQKMVFLNANWKFSDYKI